MNSSDFPTPISQIPKVEKQNNLAIFLWISSVKKDRKDNHLSISEQPKEMEKTNLLLISEDVEVVDGNTNEEVIHENYHPDSEEPQKETKYHYCFIKNLNRLLIDLNKQT